MNKHGKVHPIESEIANFDTLARRFIGVALHFEIVSFDAM